MAIQLHLKLVTPERVLFEEDFDSLTVDTAIGQITILPSHAPLVSALVPGEMVVRKDNKESYVYVAGGFVTVERGNKVVILADAAEHHYEIDEKRAEAAKVRAEKILKESAMSAEEVAETEAALVRSIARLNIVRRRAHRRGHVPGEQVETIQ